MIYKLFNIFLMKLNFVKITTYFMRYLSFVYFSYSVCAEKIHTACNDMATLFPGVSVPISLNQFQR